MNRLTLLTLLAVSLPYGTNTYAQRSARVSISPTIRYQKIDGFGGTGMTPTWGAEMSQAQIQKLWGQGDDEMNLNIMRMRIAPDEGVWGGAYVQAVKWGKEQGAFIFATPWTPPYRFKLDAEQTWGQSSNHGRLNPECVDEFAQWLEQYRAFMEQQGAAVDMISIQNECDFDPEGYEGCLYTPEEMATMVTAARKYIDNKCKVMGPECFGWDSWTYNRKLVAIPEAVENIDIWGNHIYGGLKLDYVSEVTAKTGRPMWMTEYLVDSIGRWDQEYEFIESVERCMQAGFSAYVYYSLHKHMFGNGNWGGNMNELNKRAYIFGHYGRYATGLTRVKTSITDLGSTPIIGTAYANETNDTINLFILNKSTQDVSLTTLLPFEPAQVYAIVTNSSVNRRRMDVSSQYAGTKSPKISILSESFYTLQFIKNVPEEPQPGEAALPEALKGIQQCNPISDMRFCADPTAIEYNGRLYVYGTDDQQQFDAVNGMKSNTYGRIKQLVMLSTADLINWTYHGTIDMQAVCGNWLSASWAPSIVSRVEDDGLTHFYLYFSNNGGGIGVITATSPTGPWTAPLQGNLISGSTPGLGLCNNPFDPGVVIDDKGTAWMAFGGGTPNASGTTLQPGNARIVRLGQDMVSLDSEIVPIPAPYHFEANELNVMKGKLVYSYCTSWSARTDWNSYGSALAAPSACSICYMTSDDPLDANSWKYKGEYLANPGSFGYPHGNNHAHLQKLGNSFYLLYHTQWLEHGMGFDGGYRSIAMNKAVVRESTQKISEVTAANTGILQLTAQRVNPYLPQQAEQFHSSASTTATNLDDAGNTAIIPKAGSWTLTRGVYFGTQGSSTFSARLKGCGRLEVYCDVTDSTPIATIDFDDEDWKAYTAPCEEPLTELHNIYMVFKSADANSAFDSWQFTEEGTGITETGTSSATILHRDYLSLSGTILPDRPKAKGIYLQRSYLSDGTVQTKAITIR